MINTKGDKINATDLKILEGMHPCFDGLAWGKTQGSLFDVYENCERGDWLIWFLRRSQKITKTQAVTIAITCAKHVYHGKKWNEWADRWIDGSDRTKARAAAESAAEWAEWAAEWAAESAAEWAAERAAEWAESAAERKWQADRIREIVKNPWRK